MRFALRLLPLLFLFVWQNRAENFIGCLFSPGVCEEQENCYDDLAFGRCLSGEARPEWLHRFALDPGDLKTLEAEMTRVYLAGFSWEDPYVQCVLQTVLEAIRRRTDYDASLCDGIQTLAETSDGPDPWDVAYIAFTPDPQSQFGKELFLPPESSQENIPVERPEELEAEKRLSVPKWFERMTPWEKQEMEYLVIPQEEEEEDDDGRFLEHPVARPTYMEGGRVFVPPINEETIPATNEKEESAENDDDPTSTDEEAKELLVELLQSYFPELTTSVGRNRNEDYIDAIREMEMEREDLPFGREDIPSGRENIPSGRENLPIQSRSEHDPLYERLERMDVKKPGPGFPPKAPVQKLRHASTPSSTVESVESTTKRAEEKRDGEDEVNPFAILKKAGDVDILDPSWAYIQTAEKVESEQKAREFLRSVEKVLGLDLRSLTNARLKEDVITFRVNPGIADAKDVVSVAWDNKDKIKEASGIEIAKTGFGKKGEGPYVEFLKEKDDFVLLTVSLCGALGAIILTAAAVFVVRRHIKSKEKLRNLAEVDTEASKDYQDLCRARMAGKAQEKPLIPNTKGSSKGDGDPTQSPHSSRSSTSSWSEEPVSSNLDISTGHMVLAYMEDHLKNKDRLEQEWLALCAYEAEPSTTNIAHLPENEKKNRRAEAVPYDHSRVVLNDLTNISGSDYINASSITDHDPRNPAYIATQGPLPVTAADFWQMVWEQGSVVIVMLTRLTENALPLCHRYWPEEGSEVYHIYEVHLVSEHIWCEDYLVRSFYLKNLKTGETRTVTQFHFLSWPQDGVPSSARALLEFRRKVNKSYRGRSCPIVIHCSDGAGRTGTYCLIDMVLNRMGKGAKEIDIAATLEHIRDQRPGMVATRAQFEFVLVAVAEEVHAILKALPQ